VANTGFANLGDKVIVFDTFNTQQAALDLKKIAEQLTNKPITYIINSHWHGDHIRGNQVFKDSTIIASETTYKKMKEIHPARINKQKNDIDGLEAYIHSLEEQLSKGTTTKQRNQITFLQELKISLTTLELTLPNQTFKDDG
jgi:cyclase